MELEYLHNLAKSVKSKVGISRMLTSTSLNGLVDIQWFVASSEWGPAFRFPSMELRVDEYVKGSDYLAKSILFRQWEGAIVAPHRHSEIVEKLTVIRGGVALFHGYDIHELGPGESITLIGPHGGSTLEDSLILCEYTPGMKVISPDQLEGMVAVKDQGQLEEFFEELNKWKEKQS